MNEYFQTGKDRAAIRGAGMHFFKPPTNMHLVQWHVVDTHLGQRRVQWRPGIDVWRGEEGERWTAEFAHQHNWVYVGVALKQTGGRA